MSGQSATPPAPRRHLSGGITVVAFAVTAIAGLVLARALPTARAGLVATASFSAVIAAAMVISWGAEAAQFVVSQGLAVALVALLQVLPEFMVEAVIAWHGDVKNMFANATGSNRLLIGLGWPLIFFTADFTSRSRLGKGIGSVRLRDENVIELLSLLVASSYYLKLLATGVLTLFDGVFLIGMYVAYMTILSRLPEEDEESKDDLVAPARALAEIRSPARLRMAVVALFLVGASVMAFVSEPFVESLKSVARSSGISEFDFIQWVAPFLTEFPEKVTAFYWSRKIRLAPMAMINMISSTVSQFTLLVGMIPLAYAVSFWMGSFHVVQPGLFGLPVVPMMATGPNGHDLRSEVFLSWAMTVLGCAMLSKLHFTRGNASLILGIWIAQFLAAPVSRWTGIAEPTQHWAEGFFCVAMALTELARHWPEIRLREALAQTMALMRNAHGSKT